MGKNGVPAQARGPGGCARRAWDERSGAAVDFAGTHIVVTGGSSGIGLVTARLLAERAARR